MGFVERLLGRASGRRDKPDVGSVIEQLRALAGQGRYRDAVDYAQPHALRSGDVALNREVVHLRRPAAAEAIAHAQGRPDWPPFAPDPAPDLVGIPEIAIGELTAEVMQGAILHHGSLIVRGAIERAEAIGLAADIDRVFESFDAVAAGTDNAADAQWCSLFEFREGDHVAAHSRIFTRGTDGIFAADSPVMLNRLAELYCRRGLTGVIEEHFGERPVVSVGKTIMRHAKPTNSADFHQDGAFLGADVRTINVWIALSDCGDDSPGLEVVDCRVPRIVQTGTEGANFDWTASRDMAAQANGRRPFARPLFKAGDAILFDQLMLHATSYDPAMTRTRHALEAWFFAPSAYTEQQIPLFL